MEEHRMVREIVGMVYEDDKGEADVMQARVEQVKDAEGRCLACVGWDAYERFRVTPHRYLVLILEVLFDDVEDRRRFAGSAWSLVNDAHRLDLSEASGMDVAAMAVALAAQELGEELPEIPLPWIQVVGANSRVVESLAERLVDLYSRAEEIVSR